MKIKKITPYRSNQKYLSVYDITVDKTHNYCVEGVVVSNSKRISMLDVNALLSAGATETLRDTATIRGQRNENYWLQFMSGFTPQEPHVPWVYEKFVDELRASGINVVNKGPITNIMALTNKDVQALTQNREIKSGDTISFDKGLKPIPGGLFDPSLTGGHNGRAWSYISLPEPVPSPVMEEPIRRLLDLTQKEFEAILAGKKEYKQYGKGPYAIKKALEDINIDGEINKQKQIINNGSNAKKDLAIRKLGYLKGLKNLNMRPEEWMLERVPVIPPAFRPITMLGDSAIPLVADANYLYKELLTAKDNFAKIKEKLGDDGATDERLTVYNAFKAVTGLGDPTHPKLQEKNIKGFLKHIFGVSPKFGTVQRKLLSTTVDNVGRATIIPNPNLDMDTVALPEEKAFDVYGQFIIRRLRRMGLPLTEAIRHVKDKTALAKDIMLKEMAERPVYVNRAPVLHKYGIMAFKPILTTNKALEVSPLITKSFNADFDGDTMQFHVPTTPEAIKEAYEVMLPSKSLISANDFYTPVFMPVEEDILAGIYNMTRDVKNNKQAPRVFDTVEAAKAAYMRGEISVNTPVTILKG